MPGRQHHQLHPRQQVHRQPGQQRPGLVRGKRPVRQLAQPGMLQRLNAVLAAPPSTVPAIKFGNVVVRRVRQKRGDPVPIRVEETGLRSRVQRLGAHTDPGIRRIILQLQDAGGVHDPHITQLSPVLVDRRLPVLLVADPPDFTFLQHG